MIYELARQGITIFVTTHYLDEAEHVSRVAMIFDGVLRALAPPAELRRTSLNGKLLALDCDRPLAALRLLKEAPGVRDVTLYGTVLHTLVDPDEHATEQLRDWLGEQGIGVESLAPMDPTIEDVFVSLIRSE
jgi:ABC-2 type transport system ATP-binding protein